MYAKKLRENRPAKLEDHRPDSESTLQNAKPHTYHYAIRQNYGPVNCIAGRKVGNSSTLFFWISNL